MLSEASIESLLDAKVILCPMALPGVLIAENSQASQRYFFKDILKFSFLRAVSEVSVEIMGILLALHLNAFCVSLIWLQ